MNLRMMYEREPASQTRKGRRCQDLTSNSPPHWARDLDRHGTISVISHTLSHTNLQNLDQDVQLR